MLVNLWCAYDGYEEGPTSCDLRDYCFCSSGYRCGGFIEITHDEISSAEATIDAHLSIVTMTIADTAGVEDLEGVPSVTSSDQSIIRI